MKSNDQSDPSSRDGEDIPSQFDHDLGARIANRAIIALVHSGKIDPRGKTREELLLALREFIQNHHIDWKISIDHRDHILVVADQLRTSGNSEEAIVLYATWIEHALNHIVQVTAQRSKLSVRQNEAVLRDTQIRAKFVWVHLLFGKPIPPEEYERVCLIHKVRNDFVHYKWEEHDDRDSAQAKGALEAIDLTRDYLDSFIQQHVSLGLALSDLEESTEPPTQ